MSAERNWWFNWVSWVVFLLYRGLRKGHIESICKAAWKLLILSDGALAWNLWVVCLMLLLYRKSFLRRCFVLKRCQICLASWKLELTLVCSAIVLRWISFLDWEALSIIWSICWATQDLPKCVMIPHWCHLFIALSPAKTLWDLY